MLVLGAQEPRAHRRQKLPGAPTPQDHRRAVSLGNEQTRSRSKLFQEHQQRTHQVYSRSPRHKVAEARLSKRGKQKKRSPKAGQRKSPKGSGGGKRSPTSPKSQLRVTEKGRKYVREYPQG